MIPDTGAEPVPEPVETVWVALGELIVEDDNALEMGCERQANKGGKLIARSDREGGHLTLASLGRYLFQAEIRLHENLSIPAGRQFEEALGHGLRETSTQVCGVTRQIGRAHV